MSKMTVFGLTEASRVRCSVEFLQIFLKEIAAREQFSAAVSLLYTALLKLFARLHLPQRVILKNISQSCQSCDFEKKQFEYFMTEICY